MSVEKIKFNTLFAYGLPGITFGFVYIITMTFLPKFYTDVIGFDMGFLATLVLVGRVWDAVNDPLIGSMSDRTHSVYGRRRPWILLSSFILGLLMWWLLSPPVQLSVAMLQLWFAILFLMMFLVSTGLIVPYISLGAELSKDYTERTKLYASRGVMINIGLLLVPIILMVLENIHGSNGNTLIKEHYFWLGIVVMLIIWFTGWYCFKFAKEKIVSEEKIPNTGFLSCFKLLKVNDEFRYAVIAYIFQFAIAATISSLLLFYSDHYLQSDKGKLYLLVYSFMAILAFPIWVRVVRKVEKHYLMLLSSISLIIGQGVTFFWVKPGDEIFFAIMVMLMAIFWAPGLSAVLISMIADTIDVDEYRHGKRREGAHIGVSTFIIKFASAVTVGIIFFILKLSGYESGVEKQPEHVAMVIQYLYCLVPIFLSSICIILYFFYPLSRSAHQNIRAEIDSRNQG